MHADSREPVTLFQNHSEIRTENNSKTSATSTCSISESNTQTGIVQQCNSCTSNTGSCNQLNINFNNGDAAQTASSGDTIAATTSNAASSTSHSNTQTTICTSSISNILGVAKLLEA
jgi:hypothetical protein